MKIVKISLILSLGLMLACTERDEQNDMVIAKDNAQKPTVISSNTSVFKSTGKTIQDTLPDGVKAPELAIIPVGKNTLGDTTGDGKASEKPTYTVNISQPFALGKYEVTFEEYDHYCAKTGCEKPHDEAWGRGKRPVMRVTWNDANSYVQWLSKQTGQHYYLPSEAQWEYAARAGTSTNYWWGNKPGDGNARCGDCLVKYRCVGDCSNVDVSNIKIEEAVTAPVGSYMANPYGLHDMLGNVAEWVADCWNEKHTNQASDGKPRLSGDCSTHVTKAGSWLNNIEHIRASVRIGPADGKTFKGKTVGFRVARTITD